MRLPVLASFAAVLSLAPVAGDAQQRGQRGQPPDTTRQDTTRAGVVRAEAGGEVSLAETNRGLTEAQVRELQARLRSIGCEPGEADGRLGPQTRQALACARRERGVASMNLNDLLRSLGLGFTASDSLAVSGAARTDMRAAGETRTYGDPTFVRDSGIMIIKLDTMPADAVGPGGVFVSSGTITRRGGGVWVRETSQQLRRDAGAAETPDTAVFRPVTPAVTPPVKPPVEPEPAAAPPVRRDTAPAVRQEVAPTRVREMLPEARRDTTPTVRRDTTPTVRRDTAARRDTTPRVLRPDTARAVRDSLGRTVADSTLRRMRDELLIIPPPPRAGARDTTQPDSVRTPPDTTRTPPDTTRRRRPPPR